MAIETLPDDIPERITLEKAAKMLNMSTDMLRNRIDAGKVPHRRLPGGSRWIARQDIERIVNNGGLR